MTLSATELVIEFALTLAFISIIVLSQGQPVIVGLSLALLIYLGILLGSGANHLNPAVTFGLLVNGSVGALRGFALIAVQLLAGALAVFAFGRLVHSGSNSSNNSSRPNAVA